MDAKSIITIIFFFLIGGMISCVKDPQDIPPGFSSDPAFGLAASFGNESINIEAGKDHWTNLPAVRQKDSLLVYTSVFSVDGCLDQCPSSWTFDFYQSLPADPDPAAAFSKTIHQGDKALALADQQVDSFDVILTTHPGLFMSGYSYWEDLNGPSTSFFHEFHSIVGYQENINVCFQSLAYTGCQYTQCIYFDPATQVPCLVSIQPKIENPRYISLSVRPEGTPPFQIQWFNEATSSTIVIPVHDSIAEIYAGVTVTDALGNSAHLMQTIRLQNGVVDACYFPITLQSSPLANTSPLGLEDRVQLSYLDESGVLWSSSFGVQSENAQVTINQVSSYGLSPSGEPAYLVELTARAQLFNAQTGEGRWLETGRLALALSHP